MNQAEMAEQIRKAAGMLLQKLKDKGLKIAFAESMTGGLLSGSLTRIPGASSVLCGSVVCYDHESKMRLLHVPAELFQSHGAESAEVTSSMAKGLEFLFPDAGILLAITGSASAPVNDYRISSQPGGVFICFGKVSETFKSIEWNLNGERNEVLDQAVLLTFESLISVLD
jgi:PncC family amidohydrolase